MTLATFQLLGTTCLLLTALWLFARSLPLRDDPKLRITVVLVLVVALVGTAQQTGFSLYPTLTDDASFVRGSASFLWVLALMVAAQLFVWDCKLLTAMYCCSSAYLLQDMVDVLTRLFRLMGIASSEPMVVEGQFLASPSDIMSMLVAAGVIFLIFYRMIVRRLHSQALQDVSNPLMIVASLVAILVSTIFDLTIKDLAMFDHPVRYNIVLGVMHLATSAFILLSEFEIVYNHTLQTNISVMERTVAEQARQFELSRATIDAINRRCHDIRHHILRVLKQGNDDGTLTREQLAEVARSIDVYESVLRTGNAALDVVLTEKGLLARQQGITFSCVADGHALDFMQSSDLYALFSAMLDKALNAVGVLADASRKSISLNVRQRMGMASVSLEHYLPPESDVSPEDLQLGALTLRNIEEIVGRYDGTMSYSDKSSEVIHIDLLIPQG